MFKTLSMIVALSGLAVGLSAQTSPYPDTFKVSYFSNAFPDVYCEAPINAVADATVQITNVGTQNAGSGDLYAAIYVFDPNQEMSECCACLVTPNGLLTLDINGDLTGNPLTGETLTTGAIEIVSSSSSSPTAVKPAAGIRAWATHIQDASGGSYGETETPFSDSNLSAGELKSLENKCSAIHLVGSGAGRCSCPLEK
jgi:hypothetical protein